MIVEQTEDKFKPADGTSSEPVSGDSSPLPFAVAGLSNAEGFSSALPHRSSLVRNTSNPTQNEGGTTLKHKIVRPQQKAQYDSFSAGSVQSYDQGTSNSTSNIASPTEGVPGKTSSPFALFTLANDGVPSGKLPAATITRTESYFSSVHIQTTETRVTEIPAQGQAHVQPDTNVDEMFPITQEEWEFGIMNVSEDIFDSLMTIGATDLGPVDWNSPAQ